MWDECGFLLKLTREKGDRELVVVAVCWVRLGRTVKGAGLVLVVRESE